jgi:putative NIF3 family GTP cyclohydrolase 1 type 2
VGLVLPGHYASERFAVERLAEVVSQEFPHMTTWACAAEHDPVIWL